MVSIGEKAKFRRRPSTLVEKRILPAGSLGVDGKSGIARTGQQAQESDIHLHSRTDRMAQREQARKQRPDQKGHPVNRLTRSQADPRQGGEGLILQQGKPPLRRWEPSLRQKAQCRGGKNPRAQQPIPQRNNAVRREDNHRQSRKHEKNARRPLPGTPRQKNGRHSAQHKRCLHQRRAKGRIGCVFLSAGHEMRPSRLMPHTSHPQGHLLKREKM